MNRFEFTLRNYCIVPYPFPIHYITIAQYVFKIFILNSKLRDVNARCPTLSNFIDFSDVSNISKTRLEVYTAAIPTNFLLSNLHTTQYASIVYYRDMPLIKL